MQLLYDHYTPYFTRIAVDALKEELILKRDISLLSPSKVKDFYKKSAELHHQWVSCYFTCLVFSAFALESFINGYGVRRLSQTFFEKYLEKASIESKWMLIPKLVSGQSISNTKGYTLLKKLIKARNRLAHDKPKYKRSLDKENVETIIQFFKGGEDISKQISAYESIEAIIELDKRLIEIDDEAAVFRLADLYLSHSWEEINEKLKDNNH